jgi:V-type H+-transporting ATPase subunit d
VLVSLQWPLKMELSSFNINHGFTEALIRGLRSGFLSPEDYRRVAAADSLEDVRSALEETDYGTFLQDEPTPLLVSTITKKCYEKLADEFRFLDSQCVEPASTIMDFIAREKMIDNVCMIIQGALNNKAPMEMKEKIHPLGAFEGMNTIMSESFDVQGGFDDVYRIFLVDTPIGPYFEEYLKQAAKGDDGCPAAGIENKEMAGILTKQDLEIMKATLKKAWLEDFYSFVQTIGGTTSEVLGHMLKMEADFRVLLVTLNSLNTSMGTEAGKDDRNELYPNFGYLYPEGTKELRKAWNEQTIRTALEPYAKYLELFDKVKSFYERDGGSSSIAGFQSIEDLIYAENVHMYEMSFEQQYHFGIFYSWVKLREQEIRNVRWISNMIVLQTKDHIDDTIVPIFQPRM